MGDPAKADIGQIVSYPWHHSWPYKAKSEIMKCNYLLASDNLLDQTHAAYVHKSTLSSNPDAYATAKMETAPTPDGVKFIRWLLNCNPPNLYASAVKFEGLVNRRESSNTSLHPAFSSSPVRSMREWAHTIKASATAALASDVLRNNAGNQKSPWFSGPRERDRQNDPAATEQLFRSIEEAFVEDDHVLEAQQDLVAPRRSPPDQHRFRCCACSCAQRLERKIAAERGISTDQVVTTV